MNKLIIAPICAMRYMDAAGGDGGGGEPSNSPDEPKDTPDDPKDAPDEPKDAPGEPKEPVSALAQKTKTPPDEPKDAPGKPKDAPAEPKDAPAELTDEEFAKQIITDEETKKLAEQSGASGFEISDEVTKRMIPAFRDAGVTPEQASKLSNAYAREQISQIAAHRQKRIETIKTMNQDAFKAYPNESDWKAIARARDYFFKPADKDGRGGTMLRTIATSELGSDLEFLALLKFVGERLQTDTTPTGGGKGAGHPKVSMAKALGIE